jgi:hypothetical protein
MSGLSAVKAGFQPLNPSDDGRSYVPGRVPPWVENRAEMLAAAIQRTWGGAS